MLFRIGAKEVLVGTCITCIAFQGRLMASELYGAIAISPTTWDSGIVINSPSSTEAKNAALDYCSSNGSSDCEVVIEGQECLALSGDSDAWGAALASDIETAISRASNAALSYGAYSPTPQVWGCNGDNAAYSDQQLPESSSQGYEFPSSTPPSDPIHPTDPDSDDAHWNEEECGDWSGC